MPQTNLILSPTKNYVEHTDSGGLSRCGIGCCIGGRKPYLRLNIIINCHADIQNSLLLPGPTKFCTKNEVATRVANGAKL